MANRFLSNISINDAYTLPASDGTSGQVITTDGSGNLSFSDVTFADGARSNFVYYDVKNSSGSTINKGTAVMAAGTDGNSGHVLIAPMVADGSVEPRYFMGVLETTLLNGEIGKVVHFGQISQLNTTAFSDGDVLWCDPANAGGFTITEPLGPNLKIAAAIVISSATNGKIKVRVQGNAGLHELHDVKLVSEVNGDLLQWNGTTGVWENKSLATIADSRYVNVSGDTMTGNLWINGSILDTSSANLQVQGFMRTGPIMIANGTTVTATFDNVDEKWITNNAGTLTIGPGNEHGDAILHAGNYSSYALPLSGGTITGNVTIQNGDLLISRDAVNGTATRKIRFVEAINTSSAFQGGYIYYNADSNVFQIGVHDSADTDTANDTPAISIDRATANITVTNITATSFAKSGGTSSQFLKADGSVDSNTYLTTIPTPTNGDWWNGGFVNVGTDGVMEMGKYMDFHTSDSGGNADYDLRVTVSPGVFSVGGQINATGGNSLNWNTAYDYSTIGHLPLAGGTLTGALDLAGDLFYEGTGNYALDLNNSDIIGLNSLYFGDNAENSGEGINFTNSATSNYSTLRASNGILYFAPDRASTVGVDGSIVLHSTNFTNYTDPKYLRSDESDTMTGTLTLSASNSFKATYDNTNSYSGELSWATLQLGNNGANRIVGGRTATGGSLWFYVNNTNDCVDYNTAPDGIMAMRIKEDGFIGIGNALPSTKLDVSGVITANGINLSGVANPEITFNGSSDASVDMAIKATPEGLDFYEPEDTNKIHFQILDDLGVNSPFGYQWNGQSLDSRYLRKDIETRGVGLTIAPTTTNGFGKIRTIFSGSSPGLEFSDNAGTIDADQFFAIGANDVGIGKFEIRFKATEFGSAWDTEGTLLAEFKADNNSVGFPQGRVGIGTDNYGATNAKLLVGTYIVSASDAIAQFDGFLRIKDQIIIHDPSDTAGQGVLGYNITNGMYYIGSGGGNNFGIGTTSPGKKLHVAGEALIDGGVGVASSGTFHVRQKGNTSADGIALTSAYATAHRIWKDANGKLNFGPSDLPSAFVQDLSGNVSFGVPGNGAAVGGRFMSIEGNTDGGGEGSGRIFFTEHNSSTEQMDNYGFSIGYRGGATDIVGASGNTWSGLADIGNGQWGFWGHNNSANGAVVMYGDREATYVNLANNDLNNVGNGYYNGSLAIGATSTSSAKLYVTGDTGGADSIARFQNTNAAKITRIQLLDSSASVGDGFIAYNHSNGDSQWHYLGFGINNSTSLIVNNNDDVGIGRTDPDVKLHVFESDNLYNPQIKVATDASSVVNYLGIATNSLTFYRNIDTGVNFEIKTSVASGSSGGNIVFMPDSGNHTPTEQMRIRKDGKVGIGRGNDLSYILDVKGGENDTARFLADTGDALVRIIAKNYATEADARLFLGENDTLGMTFEYDGQQNYGHIGMNDSVEPTGAFSKRISFPRDGSYTLFNAGNVGINTTAPAYKLDVVGTNGSIGIYGSGYTVNPTPMLLGMYTSSIGYIQVPSSGRIDIWNGGTGAIATFYNNNTTQFNGKVGLGTASPSGLLQINGAHPGGYGLLRLAGTGATIIDMDGQDTWDVRLRYKRNGTDYWFLGMLDSAVFKLTDANNVTKLSVNQSGDTYVSDRLSIATTSFGTNTAKFLVGDYLYNGSSAIAQFNGFLRIKDQIIIHNDSDTTLEGYLKCTAADTITTGGTFRALGDVIAYASSDRGLKDNITPIPNALDKVKAIGGYEFDWNDKQDTHEGHDIGVIAQEIEAVLPEIVTTRENGYKAVKYEKLVAVLIEAVKDQQKQIDELKAIINGGSK